MPPQENDAIQLDNDAEVLPAAPEFVPQSPPPGLGVARTLVLALLVLVGVVDLLLFCGIYLAATTPADQLPSVFAQAAGTPDQSPLVP